MDVHDRHPYAGDLVFTAFSGSHQDAIKKGMDKMDPASGALWQVPYLPIDPNDIGRTYEAIIRINSQSGKGGVAYVMEHEFGLEMPKSMHPEFGEVINRLADATATELSATEVRAAFDREYLQREEPLTLDSYEIRSARDDHRQVAITAEILFDGERQNINGSGNGPIAAFVNALERTGLKDFHLTDFREHAITGGSAADAIAFIQIERTTDNRRFWGASIDGNIELAGLKALVSACNRANTGELAARPS
jgi:2-isopropylmalate synthase